MGNHLIAPHGGRLTELLVDQARGAELREASRDWSSIDLSPRHLCDLELLLNGGFSPLEGFLTRDAYESVRDRVALRDPEGVMLAVLHVEEVWEADLRLEAERVFGTGNPEHPGVDHLLSHTQPVYVGGRLEGLQLPVHYDFKGLRRTPRELRAEFSRLGWRRVVAFQTRNPMHRAHQELTLRAAKEVGANLLIHPVVGMTKPGDVDHFTRVRCYQALLPHYPKFTAKLSLLNLAMRMGGPREAVWHAIIRKNHGCSTPKS